MRQSGRALVLVPVIYVAVILGLLFLQFSGGERFTRSVGPLTLRATRGSTGDDGIPDITNVDLTFEGMRFSFTDEQGLIVEHRSDVTDLLVTGYEELDSGFAIEFDGGFRLSFVVALDPRELRITLDAEEITGDIPLAEIRDFSVPFSLDILPADRGTAMSFATVTRENTEYYLTAPPDAAIDLQNEKIVLNPAALGQSVRYVEARQGDPTRIAELFQDEALAVSDSAYANAIGAYIDRAYEGWGSGRYRAATLRWDQGEGVVRFAEQTLTAYLAEAWERDEYDRVFTEMRRATDLYPGDLTLLSAPFLGNLRAVRARTLAADTERAAAIEERVAAGDLTVFAEPDLFRFAADRGSESLYTAVIELAEQTELRALELRAAVGLLSNLYLDSPPDQRAERIALRAVDLIQGTVLGAITDTPEGFFVQSAPGQLDVALTVRTGVMLERYGSSRNDRLMQTIGRNLVLSALAQADATGLLPASILVRGETIEDGGGSTRPEELYPMLVSTSAYPHQVSLYRELGSGHWTWSAVTVRPLSLTDESWEFELTYPRLRTHYLLIQGVPEFERMELFGQTWRDAPDFEIYSKGRHYNEESDTLMIKYYDNSVSLPVRIFF